MTGRAGPQQRALNAALRALTTPAQDKAAIELAKRYASLIDEATPASKYRPALDALRRALDPDDELAAAGFAKVAEALAEHSVASDLGPKYLAVLTSLGLTPAGRGAKGGAAGAESVARRLDEFTARRARKHAP
ncbi:hypothetical protein ACIBBG_16390 [Micromonospora chersina]|uniref:terminase small subunit n=1 Tax=Micromonospora chersina TaxID=47854 RepID=UPI0037BA4DFD